MKERSIIHIFFSRILGFLLFLILLGIANLLVKYIHNSVYIAIVNFLFDNLVLLIIILFISLLADIFWRFWFPFNLPAPILSAVSSIYMIKYIYNLWILIDSFVNTGITFQIGIIYKIVFWVVVIAGYINILIRLGRIRGEAEEKKKEQAKTEKIEWSDVGNEFRLFLYNIGKALNSIFSRKKAGEETKEKKK